MTARISLNPGTAGAHRTPTGVWTFARVFGAKTPLLGKGGVAAPIKKKREASLAGADGVVRSSTDDWKLNEPPRPRQSKERDHLLDGASTPPLPRRGVWTYLLPASAGRGRNAKFEMYVQVY